MNALPLTPEQQTEADRIYVLLRQSTEADLRQIAAALASKADHQLLFEGERQVRDLVHQLGARAVETALEERKKRGTTAPAAAAPTAPKRPNSNAGNAKPG